MTLATGVTVRIIAAGEEGAPPVLLVHGWGVHSYLWRYNIAPLVAAGYRVFAVDLPGHGLSDHPTEPGSYTLDRLTAHLDAVFEMLGVASAVVVGQSMGARIALELASRKPARVSHLALVGSVGFGEPPAVVHIAQHLPAPHGVATGLLVRRWVVALSKTLAYGTRATFAQEDVDQYWVVTQMPGFLAAVRQALVDFDWAPLTPAALRRVPGPTLVVFGTADRTVRPVFAEAFVPMMRDAHLHWVRDAGHVPNEEAPEEFNPLLLEFVAGKR